MGAHEAAPVSVCYVAGVAMLSREQGRITDVLVLTRSMSDALAGQPENHQRPDFLASLWAVVETAEAWLAAGRHVERPTIH